MFKMEAETCTEIPVWFIGTQRWVTGLTKRTTCDDVIYALLYNDGKHEDERTDKYTIYERWRDVERPLQGRTKVLKIWKAWGDEQRNVQLTMRHVDEFDEYGEFLHSRRRHHRRSRHKTRDGQSYHTKEKSHRYKSSDRLKSIDELAKTVIKQERKLHDIGCRLEGMDKEIELYETNMHVTRMEANGTDYVQNAYMCGSLEDSMDEFLRKIDPENLEMYIQFCERVIHLDTKIKLETSKIQDLSEQISDVSFNRAFCGEENLYDKEFCNSELETELSSLQAELNRIVSANMMQKYEAAEIARDIDTCDKILSEKQKTIQNLQKELEQLDKCETESYKLIDDKDGLKSKSDAFSDYVNIDAIMSADHENITSTHIEKVSEVYKKSLLDSDDTFSVDTDNTSNDSQFGYSKESTPKNGHRRNCLFIPHGKMFDDSLISERIKSEIYAYKSRSDCRLKNDGFVSASMNNNSRSDCCAKVADDDSNSDTGLSSMHSDDATSYNFLETLV